MCRCRFQSCLPYCRSAASGFGPAEKASGRFQAVELLVPMGPALSLLFGPMWLAWLAAA